MQNLPKPGFWKLQKRLVAMKENIRDFPANCSSPFIKSCDGHCKGGGVVSHAYFLWWESNFAISVYIQLHVSVNTCIYICTSTCHYFREKQTCNRFKILIHWNLGNNDCVFLLQNSAIAKHFVALSTNAVSSGFTTFHFK